MLGAEKEKSTMNMGEIIKDLRTKNGMSQEELAKKAGYSNRSTIARIESGEIDLPRSKIATIAKVFGVSPIDLFGFDEQAEEDQEFLSLIHKLPKQQKDAFLALLRSSVSEED